MPVSTSMISGVRAACRSCPDASREHRSPARDLVLGQAVDVDHARADRLGERLAILRPGRRGRSRHPSRRPVDARPPSRSAGPGPPAPRAARRPRRPASAIASRQRASSMTLAAALMTFASGLASASSSWAASRACIASTPSRSRSSRTVRPVAASISASESRHARPSRSASARPVVDLPAPMSPAMTMWRGRSLMRQAYAPTLGPWMPQRRSRRLPSSASSVAASSGGCSAMAARAMGYRVAILDPDPECPAAAVADEVVVGVLRRRRCRAAAGADECRRDLRAGTRRGGRGRGVRGGASPSGPGFGRCS